MHRGIRKESNKCNLFTLINIIWFFYLFYLNHFTNLYSDDYRVLHYWSDANHRISSIRDAAISTNEYYLIAGGRWISYFSAQYFMIFDKVVFNICNSMMGVLLGVLIYKYIMPKEKKTWLLLLIHIMLWFFTPTWGQEFLWLSGSTMYLWPMVYTLAFLLFYWKKAYSIIFDSYEVVSNNKRKWIKCFALILLGFLSGESLEPMACTTFLTLFFYVVYLKKRHIKIASYEVVGILAFILGFMILMFSPGNFNRINAVNESSNFLFKYLYRIARESYYFIVYMFPLVAAWISLLVGKLLHKSRIYSIIFGMMAISNILVMTFSAGFATRVFLTSTVYFVIAICLLMKEIIDTNHEKQMMLFALIMFFCIIVQGVALTYGICNSGESVIRIESEFVRAME